MKLIFSIIFLSFFFCGSAQTKYSILYRYEKLDTQDYDSSATDKMAIHFIADDTLSFSYLILKKSEEKGSKLIFGDKLLPHGTYYNSLTKRQYTTTYYSKSNHFLSDLNIPQLNWHEGGSSKIILGYNCKSAIAITEKGDSVLAFYTDSLKSCGGPLYNYNNLPGVVLEVFDQERSVYLCAKEIDLGNYTVVFPSKEKIVSEKERYRRIELYKKKMGFEK
jgi:GLPGLI family protein